jgi:hypothetical protein
VAAMACMARFCPLVGLFPPPIFFHQKGFLALYSVDVVVVVPLFVLGGHDTTNLPDDDGGAGCAFSSFSAFVGQVVVVVVIVSVVVGSDDNDDMVIASFSYVLFHTLCDLLHCQSVFNNFHLAILW